MRYWSWKGSVLFTRQVQGEMEADCVLCLAEHLTMVLNVMKLRSAAEDHVGVQV